MAGIQGLACASEEVRSIRLPEGRRLNLQLLTPASCGLDIESDKESYNPMDLIFYSPLSGPVVPLEDVPDPVFAQRMAGDGLAIDPLDNRVLSPCSGKVTQVHRKRHAVTLATDEGVEILIHIGIETVSLDGEGFPGSGLGRSTGEQG